MIVVMHRPSPFVALLGLLVGCHSEPPPERNLPVEPRPLDIRPSMKPSPPPVRPSTFSPSPRPAPSLSSGQLALRPNFLVIDIDSLRVDRIERKRDGQAVAPRLLALAHDGIFFDHMIAQAGWTFPSLAALLCGRYPLVSSMEKGTGTKFFEANVRTLAEILGGYGYTTAVFWGWTDPVTEPALSRGFQVIGDEGVPEASAFDTPVEGFILGHPREPFFLFVHNMDLHFPYPPLPSSDLERYTPGPPDSLVQNLDDLYTSLDRSSPESETRTEVVGHYDAALTYYDKVVGSYLDALSRVGIGERTVVVVTSDHGESLFEHGLLGHGQRHYSEVIQVPLIWSDPALQVRNTTVNRIVQGIDLAPSILARANLALEPGMPGQPILPLIGLSAETWIDREAFSLSNASSMSLRSPTHSLLAYPPTGHSPGVPNPGMRSAQKPIIELYDLVADEAETRNVENKQADVFTRMSQTLDTLYEERHQASLEPPPGPDTKSLKKSARKADKRKTTAPSPQGKP
jgi:arylsulfatase A-like enzyme